MPLSKKRIGQVSVVDRLVDGHVCTEQNCRICNAAEALDMMAKRETAAEFNLAKCREIANKQLSIYEAEIERLNDRISELESEN